ncbi:MAG: polysaccharide biosynthesis protein [Lachnospiraceae bacterium]|nr:polysaccharide biosynthesis protein [Lachnospiraceae bacterium]
MEFFSKLHIQALKGTLIRGTLLLTIAGFITRIIGFFYRVFLADHLGETLLGIYQLIFPIYGICFTIYAAGIQTAISQKIAANTRTGEEKRKTDRKIFFYGLSLSLFLAIFLSFLLYFLAQPIADSFLLEPACAPYLKILSLLFPFCGTSACINGYFYGKKRAKVPAVSQMIEQLARVGSVLFLCTLLHAKGEFGCQIAVFGVVVGEFVACAYNVFKLFKEFSLRSLLHIRKKRKNLLHSAEQTTSHALSEASFHILSKRNRKKGIFFSLLFLSGTLTGTKLILALLHSVEAVFIPAALKKYGYSSEEALALFGVFSGIALPFILFPSTVTNSFAVMLLPSIAEAHAGGNMKQIRNYVTKSGKYSLLIGYLFTALFLLSGNFCGTVFFHSPDAGYFITSLSFLCPFLYLSTTFTSIINGLGKTGLTFFITTLSLLVKIFFLIVLVPEYGIQAYLTGTLLSQMIMTIWEWYYLRNYMELSTKKYLLYPVTFFILLGMLLGKSGFF